MKIERSEGDNGTLQRQVAEIIRNAGNLVALTGAGISTGAGLADFRGKKGIYSTGEYPPNVFDIDAFMKNPKIFYTYARDFIELEKTLSPTLAHRFLARLEERGMLSAVITQNIDGLHQKAGSKNVIELHGGYRKSHCTGCGQEYDYERFRKKVNDDWVPGCDSCGGVLKPDIVFFGEEVKGFADAERIVSESDALLVIGTSLVVYPVAFLPEIAKGKVVVINKGDAGVANPDAVIVDCDIDGFCKGLPALVWGSDANG